jgi:hypothetical protein
MKCLRILIIAVTGLAMSSCDSNPLLQIAAANYSPWQVGSNWIYQNAAGARAYNRKVQASGTYMGLNALEVKTSYLLPGIAPTVPGLSVGTMALADGGSTIQIYSPSFGWVIDRKLPYVLGNNWSMPSSITTTTEIRIVDGMENVETPAGIFVRVFRLRDQITSYDAASDVTTTTGDFIWAAPNVGDIQFANIDANGVSTITARLSSYSLGQ